MNRHPGISLCHWESAFTTATARILLREEIFCSDSAHFRKNHIQGSLTKPQSLRTLQGKLSFQGGGKIPSISAHHTPNFRMASLRHWSVWFYVPNVIGYLRILFSCVAFANYKTPEMFFPYYFVGFALDAADGLAARKLDQASQFGAQLDMLTDRCATAALLTVLSTLYPTYAFVCFALIFLDGYSHWLQMVAGMCAGTSSHKQASRGWLLNMYYWRPVLTFVCSLNEMCFLMLYMLAHSEGPMIFAGVSLHRLLLWFCFPICALKQIISVRQIASAHATIADSM